MPPSSLAAVGLVAFALLAPRYASGAAMVCSTSTLLSNGVPGFTDGRCATPPDTASSEKSNGWVDSSGPGSGNASAGGGVRVGSFAGTTHVAVNDEGTLEQLVSTEIKAELFDALVVQDAALAGTAGTLVVPVHVTGSFSGSSSNVPSDAPALPPTIVYGFRFFCSGSFVGGCGQDSVDLTVEDGGPSDVPLDEPLEMTIPIVFGQQVDIDASFRLTTGVRGAHFGAERWSGLVDGTHLGTFGPATVLDAKGAPVAGAVIVADSGYDYAPEPARPLLEAFAIGLLTLRGGGSDRKERRG